jgi:hypothetical protein
MLYSVQVISLVLGAITARAGSDSFEADCTDELSQPSKQTPLRWPTATEVP